MNWNVIWRPSAEQQLAALWLAATDRQAVTAAANRIDAELEADPLTVGRARFGNSRMLIERPLAVYYDVDVAQREVAVWAVWRVRS